MSQNPKPNQNHKGRHRFGVGMLHDTPKKHLRKKDVPEASSDQPFRFQWKRPEISSKKIITNSNRRKPLKTNQPRPCPTCDGQWGTAPNCLHLCPVQRIQGCNFFSSKNPDLPRLPVDHRWSHSKLLKNRSVFHRTLERGHRCFLQRKKRIFHPTVQVGGSVTIIFSWFSCVSVSCISLPMTWVIRNWQHLAVVLVVHRPLPLTPPKHSTSRMPKAMASEPPSNLQLVQEQPSGPRHEEMRNI